jgi:transcriptional regulator with XRE-family HTH domain
MLKVAIILRSMARQNNTFGRRLAAIRKARGFTQRDLALRVGISNRMIAYYEAQTTRPPADKLTDIAKVLKITTDQLLGTAAISVEAPQNSRLWKRLKVVDKLPPKAQKKVVELAELLAQTASAQQ